MTWRSGVREREWDTRMGTIELAIPELRQGSYFPSLLEPRRRHERALLAVAPEAYVHGVSTATSMHSPRAGSCRTTTCAGSNTPRTRLSAS